MRIKLNCAARDLAIAIDQAWEQEHPTCPECDGSQLSEDGTECQACQASDYLEEEAR